MSLSVTTIEGPHLEISYSEESNKVTVSDSELVEPDIYASNGVIHTVSSLLIPPGEFQLTPEKYLLVLNCSAFVSLLHSVDLTSFINDTETHWTILAPKNDVIELSGHGELPPTRKQRAEEDAAVSFHTREAVTEKAEGPYAVGDSAGRRGLGRWQTGAQR